MISHGTTVGLAGKASSEKGLAMGVVADRAGKVEQDRRRDANGQRDQVGDSSKWLRNTLLLAKRQVGGGPSVKARYAELKGTAGNGCRAVDPRVGMQGQKGNPLRARRTSRCASVSLGRGASVLEREKELSESGTRMTMAKGKEG